MFLLKMNVNSICNHTVCYNATLVFFLSYSQKTKLTPSENTCTWLIQSGGNKSVTRM